MRSTSARSTAKSSMRRSSASPTRLARFHRQGQRGPSGERRLTGSTAPRSVPGQSAAASTSAIAAGFRRRSLRSTKRATGKPSRPRWPGTLAAGVAFSTTCIRILRCRWPRRIRWRARNSGRKRRAGASGRRRLSGRGSPSGAGRRRLVRAGPAGRACARSACPAGRARGWHPAGRPLSPRDRRPRREPGNWARGRRRSRCPASRR